MISDMPIVEGVKKYCRWKDEYTMQFYLHVSSVYTSQYDNLLFSQLVNLAYCPSILFL